MNPISDKLKGTGIMVAAMVVLSPDALCISLIGADPWTLIFWRGSLTAATLSAAMVFNHGKRVLKECLRIGLPGILSGVFFGISTISFVFSIRLTTTANTLVIVASTPLFAAAFSRIFLSERIPARTWAAVAAGISGVAIIFRGSLSGGGVLGDVLALATAMMMAANFVIIRRYKTISMVPAVVFSGILTTLLAFFLSSPLSVSATDVLLLAALGTVIMPVPLVLMTVAPKLIPAAEVSLIMLLETFLAPLWVWLVLGQKPAIETVMGGGLLITTLALHALASWRANGIGVSG